MRPTSRMLFALLALLAGQSRADAPWLVDRAEELGVAFQYDSGASQAFLMPEIMGGGVAWIDYDNDGWLDLFFVQGHEIGGAAGAASDHRLFRNLEGRGFEPVEWRDGPAPSGAYGMGVAVGDYDGDGLADLFVSGVGPDALLRNLGDGRFRDVAAQAGVGDPGWSASASFLDFDRDGALDLFVTRYLHWAAESEVECSTVAGLRDYCSPQSYEAPVPDLLYRGNGDGTFEEVSARSGLLAKPGTGLGVVAEDFDGDGWLDVFVANDGMPDRLWMNRRTGTFRDEALIRGVAVDFSGAAKAGMGVSVVDLEGDGDPDLVVGNLRGESDSLFFNLGGHFADGTARTGLAADSSVFTRFGLVTADLNHDGAVELFVANGRVALHSPADGDDPYSEPDSLYTMGADGRLAALPTALEPARVRTSRGAAGADFDHDGDIDIVVVHRDARAELLRNESQKKGSSITFSVRSGVGPATGAAFRVAGRASRARSDSSYLSASDPRVHFGLATSDRVDAEVVSVTGFRRRLTALEPGVVYVLPDRGAGGARP